MSSDENLEQIMQSPNPLLPKIVPPQKRGWFHEGQIIEIAGYLFRVKSVKPDELRLKLFYRKVAKVEKHERDNSQSG